MLLYINYTELYKITYKMSYLTQHLSQELKKSRENQGLSQREISAKSGVPQSHISKIENDQVDLRISSLIAIARALDLELALVPRKYLSAVHAIVDSANNKTISQPPPPAYQLDGDDA